MSKQKWTVENIPDLSGKIALVTGSNTGLGKETARVMAGKGATVIMAVRNLEKGEKAAQEILQEFPKASLKVMKLDLSSQKNIKSFADSFKKEYKHLDYLINNAGVMIPPYSKTEDGFELQFGTNHLGHFTLSGLLMPLLKAAPKARIMNVSSSAHNFGNIDFDDLNWEKRKYKAARAYGDSKISNLYFTYELARRLKDTAIKVTASHPGWTATDLQRHSGIFEVFNPLFGQKIPMGTLPSLRAAIDEDANSGDFYGPDGFMGMKGYPIKVRSNQLSYDEAIAQRLWDVSEKLTGIKYSI